VRVFVAFGWCDPLDEPKREGWPFIESSSNMATNKTRAGEKRAGEQAANEKETRKRQEKIP
jgi:hypothetical protein